jgi:hypothetical protein
MTQFKLTARGKVALGIAILLVLTGMFAGKVFIAGMGLILSVVGIVALIHVLRTYK